MPECLYISAYCFRSEGRVALRKTNCRGKTITGRSQQCASLYGRPKDIRRFCRLLYVRGSKVSEPVFIKLLEFGEKIGLAGTSFDAVTEWAVNTGVLPPVSDQTHAKQKNLLRDLFFESFASNSGSTESIWVLKTEYYFRLLEFRELQESRASSQAANRNSFIAMVISLIAIIFSCIAAYIQVNTPVGIQGAVTINESQIKEIIESNKATPNLSVERDAAKTRRPSP